MIVDFIDAHKEIFGVEPICRDLQVAPSTYYATKTAHPRPHARAGARVPRRPGGGGRPRRAGLLEAYLESAPQSDRFSDLVVVEATTSDGRTATVTLAALAHPVLISTVTAPWSDGIALEVTASARAG